MALDVALAERVREQLAPLDGITEKRMFGGLGFLLEGKLTVAVRVELLARIGREAAEEALARPGVRSMESQGRVYRHWVFVSADSLETDAELAGWIDDAVDFVRALGDR